MRKSKRTGLMFRKQLTNRVFGFKQWTTCKSVCLFVGGWVSRLKQDRWKESPTFLVQID